MMAGTVTVVIHVALSTVTVTVVSGDLVDNMTGTDVVISVQTQIRAVTPYTAVTYYMGSQLTTPFYRKCPLNFHCSAFEGIMF